MASLHATTVQGVEGLQLEMKEFVNRGETDDLYAVRYICSCLVCQVFCCFSCNNMMLYFRAL